MKKFSLPLIFLGCALRGTLCLGPGLVLVQPCAGGPAGVFVNTGSLATERHTHTATLLPNGKVLVAAGDNSNGDLGSAELYDAVNGIWAATGSLGDPRHRHTATLLPNGKVLVAAGGGVDPLAELYDPASGTWTATGSLTTTRNHFTATLLPDGKVLVAGGEGAGGPGPELASADQYDPESGAWTATGSLANARADHTATLLSNGKVLIAGGRNGGAVALASSELYERDKLPRNHQQYAHYHGAAGSDFGTGDYQQHLRNR